MKFTRLAIMLASAVTMGAFALFLPFPVQPAEAASMVFSSDTTISADQTIGAGETWTIDSGVTLTIAPGVTITTIFGSTIVNSGTINNDGTFNSIETFNSGTINNNGTIVNQLHIFNTGGTIFNNGTIGGGGVLVINNGGTVNNTGTINNQGSVIHIINGTLNNEGTINNFVDIFSESDGIINNNGTINNKCGAAFTSGGIFTGNPVIFEECIYTLNLFEDSDPSDGVVDLGQSVRAVVETNDNFVFFVTIRWIDPSGNVDSTTTFSAFGETGEDTFTPDEVGTWTVEADFGDDTITKSLDIRFLVIPESPIGMVALMASSFLALGGFMFWKRKSKATID